MLVAHLLNCRVRLSWAFCWIQTLLIIALFSFDGNFFKYKTVSCCHVSSVQQCWVTGKNGKEDIAPTSANYRLWEGMWKQNKLVLLRLTLLFHYSALPSRQGMGGTYKWDSYFLVTYVCSCLYLSRAEVDIYQQKMDRPRSAGGSWAESSSGDTLPSSFLPFPGEDKLAEWRFCSCVPVIWHRIGIVSSTNLCEDVGLEVCLLLPFHSTQGVCAACLAHGEKVPKLDHSAINNSVIKEREDDQVCSHTVFL